MKTGSLRRILLLVTCRSYALLSSDRTASADPSKYPQICPAITARERAVGPYIR